MTTTGTRVRDRFFRTPNDIMAAKRDDRRIALIEEKLDYSDRKSVENVLNELHAGRYHFETLLGEDFMDELEEKLKQIPAEESYHNGKKKKKKVSAGKTKKRNSAETDLKDLDDDMKRQIVKELKKQKKKQRLIYGLLSLIAVCCLGYVIFYYAQYEKNESEYHELADLKQENAVGSSDNVNINTDVEEKDLPPILAKYEKLYQKNKKIVGWLKIDGTKIDYPVMQTVNNEYYLDHNYNQEYDKNGSIFMDKDCTPAFPNTNMIIYGHHMKSGRMFGDLNRYSKKSYFEKHPQILFDTIYEEGVYDVMYVFRSRIYNADEVVFKYYQFMDVNSSEEFYSAMDEMARISLYDTGVTAAYGDRLITLSTCDSSETDGRFVVVAKKVN